MNVGSTYIDDTFAEAFGMKVDLRNEATRAADARKLHYMYGMKASEYLVDKMTKWAADNGRKLGEGSAADIQSNSSVIEAYLGAGHLGDSDD